MTQIQSSSCHKSPLPSNNKKQKLRNVPEGEARPGGCCRRSYGRRHLQPSVRAHPQFSHHNHHRHQYCLHHHPYFICLIPSLLVEKKPRIPRWKKLLKLRSRTRPRRFWTSPLHWMWWTRTSMRMERTRTKLDDLISIVKSPMLGTINASDF